MDKNLLARFLKKEFLLKSIVKQYVSFFIIGLFCFLIDFFILYLLRDAISINVYLAVTIAFVIATYTNYLLNLKWVFIGGKHKKNKEVLFFFLVAIGGLLITLLLMFLLVEIGTFFYLTAKTITVFVVSFYSFFVRKYFVFQK